MNSETPMERQYNNLKKESKDALLFFRLGDFYEMFGDDAVIASEILEIALTTRNKNSKNATPMCGIPIKSSEKYIAKLTKYGKKVAVAEQVSLPNGKGIVERKIVQIITPGVTFSDQILNPHQPTYIASVYADEDNNISVSFLEFSTGEFFVKEFFDIETAIKNIILYGVSELLITPKQFEKFTKHLKYFSGVISRYFLPENPKKYLLDFFKIQTLKSFNIENKVLSINSASIICSFIEDTQKQNISHISGISYKHNINKFFIDSTSLQNLEIFSSLDGNKKNGLFTHINNNKTPMGSRLLYNKMIEPYSNIEKINSSQNKIEVLIDNTKVKNFLQKKLAQIYDIERILSKISLGKSTPTDYVNLEKSFDSVISILEKLESENIEELNDWKEKLKNLIFSND
jgi:DNA mismatch repair protein MutS